MPNRNRRNNRPAYLICALLLAVAVFSSGCPKDPYAASMQASLNVSNGVGDGLTVLAELQKDALVSAPEVVSIAGYLGNLTTLNTSFRNSARQIHASGQTGKAAYLAAAQTLVTNANSAEVLAAVRVSNPAAQAKVQTFLLTIKSALDGIQLEINKAKGA